VQRDQDVLFGGEVVVDRGLGEAERLGDLAQRGLVEALVNSLMIEAEGLTKRYGSTTALAGIDLQVPAGAILGVLGPNGAGKTTALRS
jgi:ABC-type uncharacterized transport system ATPase subunit